jgi:voltage-gated potassium channel Kch
MLWRLLINWRDGFMAMFRPPVGRHAEKRSPAAALRF